MIYKGSGGINVARNSVLASTVKTENTLKSPEAACRWRPCARYSSVILTRVADHTASPETGSSVRSGEPNLSASSLLRLPVDGAPPYTRPNGQYSGKAP